MKLKVFTAFSGYDSQCLALDRLKENYPDFDYELVGWSEIDKIQSVGISNSQQYKLAGNSIVVDNLYHIFRKMFVETNAEQNQQLTLF